MSTAAEETVNPLVPSSGTNELSCQYVQVRGQVRLPGEYPYQEAAELSYYIGQAGGPAGQGQLSNLIVFRRQKGEKRALFYKIDELDIMPRIRAGDILVFHSIDRADQLIKFGVGLPGPARRVDRYVQGSPELRDYLNRSQFKRVFHQTLAAQQALKARKLAVLSQLPGEGKSFATAVLAQAWAAFLGARVLVVESSPGPSFLSRRDDWQEAHLEAQVAAWEGGSIDCLRFAPLVESLGRGLEFRLQETLAELSNCYDLILFDTAALNQAESLGLDPVVVASQTDAAIVVASPASCHRDLLAQVSAAYARYELKLAGVIYNHGGGK